MSKRKKYKSTPPFKQLSRSIDWKQPFNDYYPLEYSADDGQKFYHSEEWIKCRDEFKKGKDLKCCKCGSIDHICVDHKLPLRRFWQYRTHPYNLQLLCHKCNKKKSNYTDYNVLREIKDKIRLDTVQKLWRV
jgi:5-methylcytosine-specific restriction endonuclease McrA